MNGLCEYVCCILVMGEIGEDLDVECQCTSSDMAGARQHRTSDNSNSSDLPGLLY